MKELLQGSAFLGVFLSLAAYGLGVIAKKKLKLAIFNPLLVAIVLTMAALVLLHIDYETYNQGAALLSYLLTPATVCLAIPLYEQVQLLRNNFRAILAGVVSGVLASLGSVLALAAAFGLSHAEYVTFLPKSITTAIGMGVSQELGGYVPITVAAIILTGLLGNICAEGVLKLFRITEPIARGVAIGSSSHAMGTARALELGEVEGAMSSLSIVVSGLLTVVGASVFTGFL